MKIKLFVASEIQYFELKIFCFNSYIYYLTRGFIASTRAFNLQTRVFNLPTRPFSLATHAFNLATRAFNLLTSRFELVTRRFELVTRNSCFTFLLSVFSPKYLNCPPKNNDSHNLKHYEKQLEFFFGVLYLRLQIL